MKPASMMNLFRATTIAVTLAAAAASAQTPPNTLSTQEASSGYVNLFDGIEALSVKWYGITGSSQTSFSFTNTTPSSWITTTEDTFKVLQVSSGGQNHIATRDSMYRNFDLKVEWKVPSQGNSGVFLRFLKIASWGGASGSEVQVVAVDHSDGQQALHRAGTNYDMFPLKAGLENWFKPINNWNEMRIIAYENRVAHYGNGIKLLEYDMNSTAYANAYALSKYKTYPNYKTIHAGSFYLQHHGETGIKYRSMKAKKLDSTQNPWAVGSPYRKANSDSLIDTLPQSSVLFPSSTPVRPGQFAQVAGATFSLGGEGILIRFHRVDDYTLEVRDLAGRLHATHRAAGADRFMLPREATAGARLLTIKGSDGAQVFSGLLPVL